MLDVIIIEDARLLREMLADVLSSVDRIAVVAEAEDQYTCLRLMEDHQPDVVIVDLDLSAGSGIGVLSALNGDRGRYGHPKAVVFTNHGSRVLRRRCEDLGRVVMAGSSVCGWKVWARAGRPTARWAAVALGSIFLAISGPRARSIQASIIQQLSVTTGGGLDSGYAWLRARRAAGGFAAAS